MIAEDFPASQLVDMRYLSSQYEMIYGVEGYVICQA